MDVVIDDHAETSTDEDEDERSLSKTRTNYTCVQIIRVIHQCSICSHLILYNICPFFTNKESHRQQIYAIEVNNQVQYADGILFATVGSNSVSMSDDYQQSI